MGGEIGRKIERDMEREQVVGSVGWGGHETSNSIHISTLAHEIFATLSAHFSVELINEDRYNKRKETENKMIRKHSI